MTPLDHFLHHGWLLFDTDPKLTDWIAHAIPAAQTALHDPQLAHWFDCEGTWFVGVDALPNDTEGRIGASAPLSNANWARFWTDHFGPLPPLHKGQLSVVWPGYPRPRHGESDAAFRYRQNKDAAHVDGILAIGPDRQRMVREPHAFIVGLPLNLAPKTAAPLTVWDQSHKPMGNALRAALQNREDLPNVDVTQAYQAARRTVFETCEKRALHAKPGQAILLHRHLLHGISAWSNAKAEDPENRQIAYFRPECSGGVSEWLNHP